MKNIIYFVLSGILFFSCEKTIPLDINQTPSVYVIEGLVTNEYKKHWVKVSKTVPFNTNASNEQVSGAEVHIEDADGQIFVLEEVGDGYYEAVEAFRGEIGQRYTLEVRHENQVFQGSDELRPVSPIDSLTVRLDPEEFDDPEDEGRFLEVLVYLKEPQETEDFYLVKFFRNGVLENENGDIVFVYDDVALSGDLEALPAPGYYAISDTARIELYSLSPFAFKHYQDLANNIGNDGGMFGGAPANVRTNMSGGAVGLFQTSSIATSELLLE